MKYPYVIISLIITILFLGCAPVAPKKILEKPEIKSVFSLSAVVLTADQDLITVRVEKPALFKGDVKLALQLAQGIIDNSYLLEGKETLLNQSRVKVMRVIGNDVSLKILEKSHSFKPGEKVQILLEKKMIAIQDFEVIVGRNLEVAKYVQEDITTALVNSGQFNVVERLKLQSILEELKLSQMGLIDPGSAKQVGKLLGADIILTGTLAATGGEEWNANIRLVNTETGLITAAFNKKGSLELKPESFRETKNIDGSFEHDLSDMAGWTGTVGTRLSQFTGKGGYQKVYIDEKQGAKGTNRSLAMDFKLGSERIERFRAEMIKAQLMNRLKRDLSNYSGIKFFIKASKDLTISFWLTHIEKDLSKVETWFLHISVTKDWKEVRIPFNSLLVDRNLAKRLGTDLILDLRNIEKIEWVVHEHIVERGTEGTIWIDEITFY